MLGFSAADATHRHVIALAGAVNCSRLMACARCKLWWMTPSWAGLNNTVTIP